MVTRVISPLRCALACAVVLFGVGLEARLQRGEARTTLVRRRATHRRRRERADRELRVPRGGRDVHLGRQGGASVSRRRARVRVDLIGQDGDARRSSTATTTSGWSTKSDGSNSKANYTAREPRRPAGAVRVLRRRGGAEHGARGRSGTGLRASRRGDPERGALPHRRERDRRARRSRVRPASLAWGFRTARERKRRAGSTSGSCTRAACIS